MIQFHLSPDYGAMIAWITTIAVLVQFMTFKYKIGNACRKNPFNFWKNSS